ncbi:MAG: histidine kinase [Solidesulfovibrio sp.]
MRCVTGFFLAMLLSALAVVSPAPALGKTTEATALSAALIAEAAGRIDDTLADVERSAKALGAVYRDLNRTTPLPTPEERGRFLQSYAVKDGTVAFRDQEGLCGPDPQAKAPCPSLFYYDGENFTDETFRQLSVMSHFAPAMAAAHDAFPFSWVYLTTPGQNFCIYPSLPLAEAVHNYKPTEKDFYTIADFAGKTCGWLSPYFDLAGAGMMVTVSCPVYDAEKLLGVVSRDVTLAQLSARVMTDLAAIPGARAMLMNRRGKAIAASDPKVAAFIDTQNAAAGDAVVYFRADRGLAALGVEKGQDSPDDEANLAGEEVVSRAETKQGWPMHFIQGKNTVLAARLNTTGWFLVLLIPQKGGR